MKISKLFHWLYASVMLLPIFAVGVTCGYVMFNKNAYQSYVTNDTEYQVVTVDNQSQFVQNETYYFNCARFLQESTNGQNTGYIKYTEINLNLNSLGFQTIVNANQFNIRHYYSDLRISLKNDNGDTEERILYPTNTTITQFDFVFDSYLGTSSNYIDYAFYYIKEFKAPLNNVFYYAVDKVRDMSIFSWAYDSFLVAPFSYIVSLFGMPTNHVVVELLSYWLSISIIWLVFDLVMYVPLLVHRWLDKGVLE